jgi:hypothetical protein
MNSQVMLILSFPKTASLPAEKEKMRILSNFFYLLIQIYDNLHIPVKSPHRMEV